MEAKVKLEPKEEPLEDGNKLLNYHHFAKYVINGDIRSIFLHFDFSRPIQYMGRLLYCVVKREKFNGLAKH